MKYQDIYFEPAYGKVCEFIQMGSLDSFIWESPSGCISNMFLKRHLPISLDPEQKYFDIATPYGYGGPIIMELKGDKNKLLKEYEAAFSEYCKKENIICEFIRFHPLLRNDRDFNLIYKTIFMRHTVATPLTSMHDLVYDQLSRSCRKNTRRSLRQGFKVEIVQNPKDISNFLETYYDTMDRHHADDLHYFSDEYFAGLCDILGEFIININIYNKEGICMASGIFFVYGKFMHAHLSGTKSQYLKYSPAYLLRYEAMKWGIKNGIQIFHHGGGTTNDPDDSLLQFKKRFSNSLLLDFYVGQKIYNKDVYNKMVEKSEVGKTSFFPAYRDKV